jgi:hypothetical protein
MSIYLNGKKIKKAKQSVGPNSKHEHKKSISKLKTIIKLIEPPVEPPKKYFLRNSLIKLDELQIDDIVFKVKRQMNQKSQSKRPVYKLRPRTSDSK